MKNIILRAFESFKEFHVCFFVVMTSCFLVFSCYGPDMFDLANSDASKGSPEPPVEDVNNVNNMQVTLDSVISGDGFVKIEWIDPDTEKFTSINIYDESDDSLKTSVDPGVQQVTIDGLINGTKYALILRVQDDVGNLGPEVRVSAIPDSVEKDYILIHNAQELNAVRDNISADYLVVEDIDLAGAYTPWVPICDDLNPFTGTFNGNGHVIENMKITANYTEKGLFGYVGNGIAETKVTDVVLTGFQIAASNTLTMEYAGAIAGYCHKALIKNCDVSGEISVNGKASIGGITGYNSAGGIIENSESDVVIEGSYVNDYPVGGLVGGNYGLITDSVARVDIDVNTRIGTGGIAGFSVSGATINYCSVNVKKIRSNEKVGGIIGANNGVVNYCNVNSDNGSITGTKWVGGFVGTYGEGYVTGPSSVNLGLVSGSELAGGFAGQVSAGGINGPINIKVGKVKGAAYVGGFAGQIGSDTSPSPVIVSVDDVSVQADVEYNGTSPSSEEDAFIGGFAGFIINTNSCSISNSSFSGDVNASHKINIGGFIGNVDQAKVIINDSFVSDCKVNGVKYVGGFVGAVTGDTSILTINNCSSSAEIKGGTVVGGFVGYVNSSTIVFTDVASHGSIMATDDGIGGFAGFILGTNVSTIDEAYSAVSIEGDVNIGGFVGSLCSRNLTISNVNVEGDVLGSGDNVGGFIGKTYKSTVTIEESRVKSEQIKGKDNVGGFFGFVTTDGADTVLTVKTCYSSADISGEGNVGGFVGNIGNEDASVLKITFSDTASYGTVVGSASSNGNTGGFAGIFRNCASDSKITRAYSRAEVKGMVSAGGFAGVINSTNLKISQAYAAGSVSHLGGTTFKGGFIGSYTDGEFENCYWDTMKTGQSQAVGGGSSPTGITGLSTGDMHTQSKYDGWSIGNTSSHSGTNWIMDSAVNNEYPYPVTFYELWGADVP